MNYSVVIPAYNEEKSIASILREITQKLNQEQQQFEIVVVNDGSTDKTREQVLGCGVSINFIDRKINKGYGASLKEGINAAKYDIIVITDADGTYPNERIPELIRIAESDDYDMVVGARIGKDAKIPLIRKPAKWFIGKLANYLGEYPIPDINSGLRVMKKAVVKKFFNILPSGFSFTTTITLAMLTNGHTVKYVPIEYYKREGKSKIRPIRDTLNFIQLIVRTVMYFNPLRIFVPLALGLTICGIGIFLIGKLCFDMVLDSTFNVLFYTAITSLSIGMLADLIDKRVGK